MDDDFHAQQIEVPFAPEAHDGASPLAVALGGEECNGIKENADGHDEDGPKDDEGEAYGESDRGHDGD